MAYLEVQKLDITFGLGSCDENHVLRSLSLTCEKGEFITIIGSNGAGKSTLFNSISGAVLPDSGHVRLDNKDITLQKEHFRARSIGRLFQDPRMGTAGNLTIEENLALVQGKTSGGFPLSRAVNKTNRAAFKTLLSRLEMGMEDRLSSNVGTLSGGQRQALTLLMATLVPPKLLLLDEHTAALDPVSAKKVLSLTSAITSEHNITTLMITHNIAQALAMGTRTIMLHEGRVVMDLPEGARRNINIAELLERYKEAAGGAPISDRMVF
ncbi:ABC transporter ATP-binding protein [Spirochaetia bacterium]|nr:ABC transporter ATP-binding protein [Spirochaetia bacterium]